MYAAETSYHQIKRESSDFNRHDTYKNKEEQTKHYLAQHYTKNDHNPQFDSKYNSQATSQYSQNSQNSQNSPNSDNHQTSIQLNDNILRNFGVAKKLDVGKGQVNSISFNSDGKFFVAGCHDDTITLFDVNRATKSLILNSKKYGVEKITFTRDDSKVLYASNKVDDAIRYQSLEDNKYIRYFSGHRKQVTSLNISPSNNFFISSSNDNTVRLWDISSPDCTACINFRQTKSTANITSAQNTKYVRPVSAIDPEGLIFAVVNTAPEKRQVQLLFYDLKAFHYGPFLQFNVSVEKNCEVTGIEFSPDGKYLLLLTNIDRAFLCNTTQAGVAQEFKGLKNSKEHGMPGGFSPDGSYIYLCSNEGRVRWYKIDTFQEIWFWDISCQEAFSIGETASSFAKDNGSKKKCNFSMATFNPKFCMFASASDNGLHLWLPSI